MLNFRRLFTVMKNKPVAAVKRGVIGAFEADIRGSALFLPNIFDMEAID